MTSSVNGACQGIHRCTFIDKVSGNNARQADLLTEMDDEAITLDAGHSREPVLICHDIRNRKGR